MYVFKVELPPLCMLWLAAACFNLTPHYIPIYMFHPHWSMNVLVLYTSSCSH